MNYFNYTVTFDINELFKFCQLKSLYSGSSITNDSGATQESSFALTENERDFFNIVLKDSASKLYDAVSQDTKIVQNPLQYNNNGQIIYNLLIHADWDKNQSFGLSTQMEKSLVSFVLREWFKLRGVATHFQTEDSNYQSAIQEVRNLLNRRIRSVQRVYRYLG